MTTDMKHLQRHNGRLFYRRKIPTELRPAFEGKTHWRRALELPVDAPEADIASRWSELHEAFEALVSLARSSNTEVLAEVDLQRKARAYLRDQRLAPGALSSDPIGHGTDALFGPDLSHIEHKRQQGQTLTPQEQVIDAAYWLAVADRDTLERRTLLFSECYADYIKSRDIDTTQRRHKNVAAHWARFMDSSGDQKVTKANIERALDSYTEQRQQDGVTSATIDRELNLVCSVLRRGIRRHRLDVQFTRTELKRHKRTHRGTLSQPQQQTLVQAIVAGEVPQVEGLVILLALEGGMILSETARLLKTSVHMGHRYPHLFVEGEAKTTSRLRPVPLTVATGWTRATLRAIHEADPTYPYALGERWHKLTESGRGAAVKRHLPTGFTSYSLRHATRANAIANCGGDTNTALICGWSAGGLSEHMFTYASSALQEGQEELLGGLWATSEALNKHLLGIKPAIHLQAVTS